TTFRDRPLTGRSCNGHRRPSGELPLPGRALFLFWHRGIAMEHWRRGLAAGAAVAVLAWSGGALAQDTQATAPPDADGLSEAPADAAPARVAPSAPESPPGKAPFVFGSPGDAILGGKLLFETRARYEFVDQKRTPVLTENGEA